MDYDDEANGGAPPRVRVSKLGGGFGGVVPRSSGPPTSRLLSCLVAVANVAILRSSSMTKEKSQLSQRRVTMSALGNDRVNRVLPSDLWLKPRSRRQNSQPAGIRHAC